MRAILFSAIMVLGMFSFAAGQAIMVDHVDGLNLDGTIPAGGELTFHMRVVGDGTAHLMLNNGFTFSSADVTWGSIVGEFVEPNIATWFDFVRVINLWANGSVEDTVGIGLLSLFGLGMPAGYDNIMYTFTIGPVDGPAEKTMTLDSSWYPPSNPWMWDVCGVNVGWGGPYTYAIEGGSPCAEATTYCTPQPTILKAMESVLAVHIVCEETGNVILESIRVQGKIPPYNPAQVIGDEVVTYAFIYRFLGASGFRPITADFEATYTVEYDKTDGSHPILTGDFALQVYPGDVTFDGRCDMADVILMSEYFFNDGDICRFDENSPMPELMDINQDGELNPLDLRAVIDLAEI